jgi:hypothetical protein
MRRLELIDQLLDDWHKSHYRLRFYIVAEDDTGRYTFLKTAAEAKNIRLSAEMFFDEYISYSDREASYKADFNGTPYQKLRSQFLDAVECIEVYDPFDYPKTCIPERPFFDEEVYLLSKRPKSSGGDPIPSRE